MQRRVYAPNINLNKIFDLSEKEKQISESIHTQKPFKTPNNASKRLLDAIKKIELEYAFNSNDEDEIIEINGQQTISDYDDDYDNNDSTSFNLNYVNDPADVWFLDSPTNEEQLIKPHQSRLNHQFQRITKNQEKVKLTIQQIKEDIIKLDDEYEQMGNIIDLSF